MIDIFSSASKGFFLSPDLRDGYILKSPFSLLLLATLISLPCPAWGGLKRPKAIVAIPKSSFSSPSSSGGAGLPVAPPGVGFGDLAGAEDVCPAGFCLGSSALAGPLFCARTNSPFSVCPLSVSYTHLTLPTSDLV